MKASFMRSAPARCCRARGPPLPCRRRRRRRCGTSLTSQSSSISAFPLRRFPKMRFLENAFLFDFCKNEQNTFDTALVGMPSWSLLAYAKDDLSHNLTRYSCYLTCPMSCGHAHDRVHVAAVTVLVAVLGVVPVASFSMAFTATALCRTY